MRAWVLVRLTVLCGACGRPIAKGEPALRISGRSWTMLRCEACAGEPKPAVIADQPSEAQAIRSDFQDRVASMRGIARDWKHAQANEQED